MEIGGRMIKKLMITLMIIGFTLTMGFADMASTVYEESAQELNDLGLFKGTNKGYELDKAPSRVVGAVMLIRLMGVEEEVNAGTYTHPFTDVPTWADKYIGYMYEKGLTEGVAPDKFGATALLDQKSYMTFVLRALGYKDSEGDFSWLNAIEKGLTLNIIDGEEKKHLESATFLRGNMVLMSRKALLVKLKDKNQTLEEKLFSVGAIAKKLGQGHGIQVEGSVSTPKLKFEEKTGLYGYVDTAGKWQIQPKFATAQEFSEGLAFTRELNTSEAYFINVKGEKNFENKLTEATSFDGGYALIRKYAIYTEDQTLMVIDNKGKVMRTFNSSYSMNEDAYGHIYLQTMKDGITAQKYLNDRYELIDIEVRNLVENDGRNIVYGSYDNLTIMDINTGKTLSKHKDVKGVDHNIVSVKKSEGIHLVEYKVGNEDFFCYYDEALAKLVEIDFSEGELFSEGLASAAIKKYEKMYEKTKRYGYIDKEGNWSIKPMYVAASSFKDGRANVKTYLAPMVIDQKNNHIMTFNPPILVSGTSMTADELEYVQSEVKRICDDITKKEMSDEEKVRIISKYIVENTKYDYENYSKKVESVPRLSYTPYGALKFGISVCEGYAELTQLMLNYVGVENQYISGFVKDGEATEGHAWNLVKMDGKFYHLDNTWNESQYRFLLVSDTFMKNQGNREWLYDKFPVVAKGYYNDLIQDL